MPVTIVCVEPENPGNIGAIARAMENFGLSDLILINPKAEHNCEEAHKRAKHAGNVLDAARVGSWSDLDGFDCLVATSAKIGTDYNIPRAPLTPAQLAEKININAKVAVLFGRESCGLTNEEIARCDFIVAIPACKKYPTLNLSHAACIIFYELFLRFASEKTNDHIEIAGPTYKRVILQKIDNILDNLEFSTENKKETQRIVWKKIIGKAMLTKREAFAILGFLRKLEGETDGQNEDKGDCV